MTAPTPDIPAVFTTVADLLGAAVTHPTYKRGAPADVDASRPWIVIRRSPGGGPNGTPIQRNREWIFGVQVIGAARNPNAQGQPTQAVYDAASDAAEDARAALLDPALWRTAGIVTTEFLADYGEDSEGDVVNVTADYQVIVGVTC